MSHHIYSVYWSVECIRPTQPGSHFSVTIKCVNKHCGQVWYATVLCFSLRVRIFAKSHKLLGNQNFNYINRGTLKTVKIHPEINSTPPPLIFFFLINLILLNSSSCIKYKDLLQFNRFIFRNLFGLPRKRLNLKVSVALFSDLKVFYFIKPTNLYPFFYYSFFSKSFHYLLNFIFRIVPFAFALSDLLLIFTRFLF